MLRFSRITGTLYQHMARLAVVVVGVLTFLAFLSDFMMQPVFCFGVVAVYLLLLPKKILNPKNIVFFFYFLWYVLSPYLSSSFTSQKESYADKIGQAFFMCFLVYLLAMLTLDICIAQTEKREARATLDVRQDMDGKLIVTVFYAIGLYFYFTRTGGLSAWLADASSAFFSRRGIGQWYLLYTLSLNIMIYFAGIKIFHTKKKALKMLLIVMFAVFLALNFPFVGSRGTMLMLALLLFSSYFINSDMIGKNSFFIVGGGCVLFVFSLFQRLKDWKFTLLYFFNYFNSFELFCRILKDYDGAWFQTCFMPLAWPFSKIGLLKGQFYDMSVWLTTEYFKGSWENDFSTQQWNIETDLYLSFHFYWGLPVIVLYFAIIAWLYKKAYRMGGIWKFIYICEFIYILSHLRGGIFIYWYWYLIPLYLLLVYKYGNKRAKKPVLVQGIICKL